MSILFYLGAPEKSNKNIKVASLTSSTSVHSPIKGISKESLQRIAEIKQNLKSNKQIILYMIFCVGTNFAFSTQSENQKFSGPYIKRKSSMNKIRSKSVRNKLKRVKS